jgi:2-oxoglutarate ferredoxin oxidoreductase subunit alpha
MRGGPGLGKHRPLPGGLLPGDPWRPATDYRTIVLAPGGGQELADLTGKAFDYADRYRTPVVLSPKE